MITVSMLSQSRHVMKLWHSALMCIYSNSQPVDQRQVKLEGT